jgi:hypothetical protein
LVFIELIIEVMISQILFLVYSFPELAMLIPAFVKNPGSSRFFFLG